mmetsp:Transcript_15583/g.30159  ORF Transcript_15583/g.30159 Transcript_15583/m.30159 type:complete len:94 (-) Transcript_15583:1410-1691(-)
MIRRCQTTMVFKCSRTAGKQNVHPPNDTFVLFSSYCIGVAATAAGAAVLTDPVATNTLVQPSSNRLAPMESTRVSRRDPWWFQREYLNKSVPS